MKPAWWCGGGGGGVVVVPPQRKFFKLFWVVGWVVATSEDSLLFLPLQLP